MSKFFLYFHMAYAFIAIFAGIASFGDISFSTSVSGILAPLIAWFGGSGLRGSFNLGDKKQKITGFIAGLVFLGTSLFWIDYTGYWITIWDVSFSGPLWVAIGFIVGLIFSTKKHSENKF